MESLNNEEIFDAFIRQWEEVCRHDGGSSEERALLEYLEERFGVQSCRYNWDERPFARPVE